MTGEHHPCGVGVVGFVGDVSWPAMIWLGGAQGAGRSTIAWLLSRHLDLPLHPVDMWAYDHQERLPPASTTLDEELAQDPEHAAAAFVATAHARLPLVLADVRARATEPVPVLVEGPQLLPSMATPLPAGSAVFLVPTPERTRAARVSRPDADPRRLDRLVARDTVIADLVRSEAAATGRPVVEVPEHPDWLTTYDAVRSALEPGVVARLAPGRALAGQRAFENDVAARQGRLWAEATGRDVVPGNTTAPYRWACECGASGCTDRSPLGTRAAQRAEAAHLTAPSSGRGRRRGCAGVCSTSVAFAVPLPPAGHRSSASRPSCQRCRRSSAVCSHHGVPRSPRATLASWTLARASRSSSASWVRWAAAMSRRAVISRLRRRAAGSGGMSGSVARHRRPLMITKCPSGVCSGSAIGPGSHFAGFGSVCRAGRGG
ncbi:hypothetical protein BBK82_42715 [Lentzea guizhouensis]|uniref:Uncharacterized protein n=1 Tax=Lentzea guizhouensis TaxID=1586287 RepID=A0A1B2HVG5_9PSEU|nr:hypothetical protein [Lentzea guizhouensis]ANZ41672.1 hypothetical protein BBK82_42715 [Lentzea guizhouensis]